MVGGRERRPGWLPRLRRSSDATQESGVPSQFCLTSRPRGIRNEHGTPHRDRRPVFPLSPWTRGRVRSCRPPDGPHGMRRPRPGQRSALRRPTPGRARARGRRSHTTLLQLRRSHDGASASSWSLWGIRVLDHKPSRNKPSQGLLWVVIGHRDDVRSLGSSPERGRAGGHPDRSFRTQPASVRIRRRAVEPAARACIPRLPSLGRGHHGGRGAGCPRCSHLSL